MVGVWGTPPRPFHLPINHLFTGSENPLNTPYPTPRLNNGIPAYHHGIMLFAGRTCLNTPINPNTINVCTR